MTTLRDGLCLYLSEMSYPLFVAVGHRSQAILVKGDA